MEKKKLIEKLERNERVEMLSDGVFAIVLTLLVLELRVPQLHEHFSDHDLLSALYEMKAKFLGFILSFVFIATLWFNHTVFFKIMTKVDDTLLWLNNLFLLTVCFVPFPTALAGEYPSSSVAMILFGLPWLIVPLVFYWMGTHCMKRQYISPLVDMGRFKVIRQYTILFIPASLVPMILSLISPVISLVIYIIMAVAGVILGFKLKFISAEED